MNIRDFKNNINAFKKIYLVLNFTATAKNLAMDKILFRKRTPFPRLIAMFITNRCNLNCKGCLNGSYRNKHITEEQITVDHIKKILPELKKYKPMFYITGGEPLIRQNTFDIISLLSKNGIMTSMSTNGFLLNNNVDKILNSGLNFLSVSLDHYQKEIHNKVKGNNSKIFNKVTNGLNLLIKKRTFLKKMSLNIKVNTVVRKENYSELSNTYDFVESLGVDEWCIQHFSFHTPRIKKSIDEYKKKTGIGEYTDGTLINSDHYLNKNEVKKLIFNLDEIQKKAKKYKTKLSIKPQIDNLFKYYSGKFPSKESSCTSPLSSIKILSNGDVTLCLGYKIGNLNNPISIKKMWDSEKSTEFQKMIQKEKVLPPCFGCHSLNYKSKP